MKGTTLTTYIDKRDQLAQFAKRAMNSSFVCVDTEFLREKTYFPKLCLVQMATEDEVVIIDPLATSGIGELADVFASRDITKVFHAGAQDIEIIYNELGIVPKPLFDTQIAATVLGHSLQTGLAVLVASICGVRLRKGDSFTDWQMRPLRDSQIAYAADDVNYLPRIYTYMLGELERLGRSDWLEADFNRLADLASYHVEDEQRYKKLKRVSQLNRRQLAAAREAAAWRERMAKQRDIPRRWVLSDEEIVEACKRDPKTLDDLLMVRGMKEHLPFRDARALLACMRKGYDSPRETWPELGEKVKSEANVDSLVDALSAIVRLRAREQDIAYQVLASHDDLVDVARGHDSAVMHGWRRRIVGDELKAFVDGRVALTARGGHLLVTQV